MTFKQLAKIYLADNGMFDSQADEVIETVINAKENESMLHRWDEDVRGYPDVMQKVLLLTIRNHAIEWIDENIPGAWFREMFE